MGVKGLTVRGVPPLPKWLLYTKIALILLSMIILALAAYAISIRGGYSYYYSSGAPGFLIFLAIYTWIVYGGSTAVEIWAPEWYFRLAVFAAYILAVIFWLSGWAWAASWGSFIRSYANYYGPYRRYGSVMSACAGLGALAWVITIVNLVFFIMVCLRKGGPKRNTNVELGEVPKSVQTGNDPTSPQPIVVEQPVQEGNRTQAA